MSTQTSAESRTSTLVLKAPLSGFLVPIESVPDPVFAQKMVGDGVSIDPTSASLLAPCQGTVIQIHSANHALTIRTDQGLEVMMHIGLDTVHLKGQGFTPRAKVGQKVETGTPLIDFDPDFLSRKARSLLTQIVITTPDLVGSMKPSQGEVRAPSDQILQIEIQGGRETSASAGGEDQRVVSETVIVPNQSGLHARPAATLVGLAKRFQCGLKLCRGDARANARSVSAIMALDVKKGEKVFLEASGSDAREAVDAILPQIVSGLGEKAGEEPPAPEVAPAQATKPRAKSEDPNLICGIPASPGLAMGQVFILGRREIQVPETGSSSGEERKALEEAISTARLQLSALQNRMKDAGDTQKSGIFGAHLELLDDPDLMEIAESAIVKGKSAAFAWKAAFTTHAERLAGLPNALLAARANDFRDVGRRVLGILCGEPDEAPEVPARSIILAEDLSPSEVAHFDKARILGFATVGGGATSHVAIMARSAGVPAIVAAEPRLLDVAPGAMVVLDATKGTIALNPSPAEAEKIRAQIERQETRLKEDAAAAHQPAATSDGAKIEVFANIGNAEDAREAQKNGAGGVGLLRSEFLFLERKESPTEEEQYSAYKAAAEAIGKEKTLIVRTLDVGGDKPLAYLPIPREDNPFLGERGIRVGLNRPEILRTQVRAILRAAQGTGIRMMFPMVGDFDEWVQAKAIVAQEAERLGTKPVPLGIMIEIPSAALCVAAFAAEAEFFSIGTNDLTQYTLAMDRGHPKLAGKVDALHPAVLRLISQTVEAAHQFKRHVGVCGGLAGDRDGAPILLGLGVDELSVSVPAVPSVKAAIRRLNSQTCRDLAKEALTRRTAAEVRSLVRERLERP